MNASNFTPLKELNPENISGFKTKDGRNITFTFEQNTENENRGFVVHKILAFVEGKEAGYLKISYIDKNENKRFNSTFLHWEQNFGGSLFGIEGDSIRSNTYLEKERANNSDAKYYFLDSIEGKQTLFYTLSSRKYDSDYTLTDILNLNESNLDELIEIETAILEKRSKKDFDFHNKFHVNKPLVDYIRVYKGTDKEENTLPDTKSNQELSDETFTRLNVGKALYQIGAIWLGINNMELHRSGCQSECAKKVDNSALTIKNLVSAKEARLKDSYDNKTIIRKVLSAKQLKTQFTKNNNLEIIAA